jgi:TrmH family RNA methyltransferase
LITSPDNQLLKEIRKLQRRSVRDDTRRFVAEGEDLLAAADEAGWPAVATLVAGVDVEGELLARVSTLGSGTRAIGIYEQRWAQPAGPVCVYLHGVADPGNIGTILRSALAFGAGSVVLGPGCADPYSPKAVRASMGAVFAVPLARAGGVDGLPGETVALAARAGEPLAGPAPGPVTIVVGAERDGLPEDVLTACDRLAHIAIRNESLNAAMAATVALYELTRVAPG